MKEEKEILEHFAGVVSVFFSLWLLKFIVAFSQCKINSPQSVFYTAFFAIICACLGYANNLFCLLAFFFNLLVYHDEYIHI